MNTFSPVEANVKRLLTVGGGDLISNQHAVGIEKESLRVSDSGMLAKTPHPKVLGSALTHPYITTDFSESLLELLTPPLENSTAAIDFLSDIHSYVYAHLDDELLWCASMPCIVKGETDIPLAYYGTSNIGRMKTIYRRGLGYRYGRAMQTIAGVHFNYSLGDAFWEIWHDLSNSTEALHNFRSKCYMGLIRNFLRIAWLIPYLFGASPAVCRTFVATSTYNLQPFDKTTLYGPYATSLRMGDIGYQNNQEADIGVKACYDSVDDYVQSLGRAVRTESNRYRQIGVKQGGEYRQLSAAILQIENEYYSTVRPKQSSVGGEMPLAALKRNGVEYVELRSLDIDVFQPTGVSLPQLHFIEALMFFCLLDNSPNIAPDQWAMIDGNEIAVAHNGRRAGLQLNYFGNTRELKNWGLEICDRIQAVCQLLDDQTNQTIYRDALEMQIEKLKDSDACPSALMLAKMRQHKEGFVEFVEHRAVEFKDYFAKRQLSTERFELFNQAVANSLNTQLKLETEDTLSLDEYISDYYAQLDDLVRT